MATLDFVTTCHAAGFEQYGERFLEGWMDHAPEGSKLWFFPESFNLEVDDPRVTVESLHDASPDLVQFKFNYSGEPEHNGVKGDKYCFQWDAIRFANKVFAIKAAMERTKSDVLIWIDADVVFHKPLPQDVLESWAHKDIACLKRDQMWTECGFVIYRLNPQVRAFITDLANTYLDGSVFDLDEWHDSFVFDAVRANYDFEYVNLSGEHSDSSHPFVVGPLGKYMDHLKGPTRKDVGYSKERKTA